MEKTLDIETSPLPQKEPPASPRLSPADEAAMSERIAREIARQIDARQRPSKVVTEWDIGAGEGDDDFLGGVDGETDFFESSLFEDAPRPGFLGYGMFGVWRYYDPDIVPDTTADHLGIAITDNSGGLKTWIKISLSANTVTYEATGPATGNHPPDEVWYKVADITGPFPPVHRTG